MERQVSSVKLKESKLSLSFLFLAFCHETEPILSGTVETGEG